MIYLIYGPPCSGKSTYIQSHLTEGDIVCDVDLIYSAISGRNPHDADLWAHETALLLKDRLLNIIRDKEGGWKNAYVTSLANTPEKLAADMERVKADEAILIDTPKEVCLERAKNRPPYFSLLIEEWFSEEKGYDKNSD